MSAIDEYVSCLRQNGDGNNRFLHLFCESITHSFKNMCEYSVSLARRTNHEQMVIYMH